MTTAPELPPPGPHVAYYLIVDEYTRPGKPAGVLRCTASSGTTTREVFGRALTWRDVTDDGYPAEETERDLFEIPASEAARIIINMKRTAAAADDRPAIPAKPTVKDLGIDPGAQHWKRSGDSDGSIEIAFPVSPDWDAGDWVLMRVSGNTAPLTLVFDRNEWTCFLDGVAKGEFDDAVTE